MIQTIRYYYQAFFVSATQGSSEFAIASKALFGYTFRFEQSRRNSFFLVPWNWIRVIRWKVHEHEIKGQHENFFIDNKKKKKQHRTAYLEFVTNNKIQGVSREELRYFRSVLVKASFVFLTFPLMLLFFFSSWFAKDKGALASCFSEIVENNNLRAILRASKVQRLYMFCIFEKDSNLFAHMIRKDGVRITKITSEVPIGIWNQRIITDTVAICNGLQLEELEKYADTIICRDFEFWGPEGLHEVFEQYNFGGYPVLEEEAMKTIAFYSTGGWVREKLGHASQGLSIVQQEDKVLSMLQRYVAERSHNRLMVFLHPRERAPEFLEEAKNRYLKNDSVILSDPQSPSNKSFQSANVAVAFNTTLMYERLYFGFKGILVPMNDVRFPIQGLSIERICVKEYDALEKLLDKALSVSNIEYFEELGIDHYCWFNQNVKFAHHVRNSPLPPNERS